MCSHHRNAFPSQYHGIHQASLPAELYHECTAIEYIIDQPLGPPPSFFLVVDLVIEYKEMEASLFV